MNPQELNSVSLDSLKQIIRETVSESVKSTIKEAVRDTVRNSVQDTIKQAAYGLFTNIGWKHFALVTVPTVLYYLSKPIMKLIPKPTKDYKPLTQMGQIKEIILTSCEMITFENLDTLHVTKGNPPKHYMYKVSQKFVIEEFVKNKKNLDYKSEQLESLKDEIVELHSVNLWNNFRLSKMENSSIKIMIIKGSSDVLKKFYLKFYRINQNFLDKIGSFDQNKLNILRFDANLGTYEHLTCQFDQLQKQRSLS